MICYLRWDANNLTKLKLGIEKIVSTSSLIEEILLNSDTFSFLLYL